LQTNQPPLAVFYLENDMGKVVMNGAKIAVASAYGDAITISAASNAENCVLTLEADHGLVVGDPVEVSSGWAELNERVFLVKAVSSTAVTLDGGALELADTSDTIACPVGEGVGSVRKITGWMNISQIKDPSTSGGDMQSTGTTDLDSVIETSLPTIGSEIKTALTVYDDPALPWVLPVFKLSKKGTLVAVRTTFKNGARNFGNATLGYSGTAAGSIGNPVTATLTVNYNNLPVRYAKAS